MMVSLKQLDALYWIVELGTFQKAAIKLHTSQSAISKRIQELEASTCIEIFDRSQRGARLTEKGEELLELSHQILNINAQIMALREGHIRPVRKLKLGVTELTAWTWLPRLVAALQGSYPKITIEPVVDLTRSLFDYVREGSLDLIIAPQTFRDHDVTAVQLAEVKNSWMAKPKLIPHKNKTLPLEDLLQHPILVQGSRSGSGLYFNRWLRSQGVRVTRVISTDSLNAILGLTVAGLGVSYFPRDCFQPFIEMGQLETIDVSPVLPPVPYAAMYRSDLPSPFIRDVVEIAKETCDFSHQFQK